MTTAAQRLIASSADIAFVCEFEGIETAFCTTGDSTALAAAWTTWTTMHSGMARPDPVTRKIAPFTFALDKPMATVRIVDTDQSLAATFATALSTADVTFLTAALDRDDTTITVKDTGDFASSGTIHIGHERITYSGKGATTFTGCTRGTYPHAGKAAWAHSFAVDSAGEGAIVSTQPRIWKGRGCQIWLTAKDPATGAWIGRSDAVLWFVGYAKDDPSFDGATGAWTIPLVDVLGRLDTQILRNQYKGILEGFYCEESVFNVRENDGTSFAVTPITIPAGAYTGDSLLTAINNALEAATLLLDWGIARVTTDGGPRTRVTAVEAGGGYGDWEPTSVTAERMFHILGFVMPAMVQIWIDGTAGVGYFDSTRAPVRSAYNPLASTLTVVRTEGAWADQDTTADLAYFPSGTEGFLRVGDADHIVAVAYDDDVTFTRKGLFGFDGKQRAMVTSDDLVLINDPAVVRFGEPDSKLTTVKQVFLALGPPSRLLLRLLLSTGTTDYNTD